MNSTVSPTARSIAAAARGTLGRAASGSTRNVDWPATEAVRAAAVEAGLDRPLNGWVRPESTSLTRIAQDYLYRYAESYGPVCGLPIVL